MKKVNNYVTNCNNNERRITDTDFRNKYISLKTSIEEKFKPLVRRPKGRTLNELYLK